MELGRGVDTDTPEQFAALIQSEILKWGRLIKELGVRPE